LNKKTILLNVKDNVATALVELGEGETVNARLDDLSFDVTLSAAIPFGHKYAVCDIPKGQEILKYGLPIGRATEDIKAGEWVHVHNCRSDRFGFHREQYGLNA